MNDNHASLPTVSPDSKDLRPRVVTIDAPPPTAPPGQQDASHTLQGASPVGGSPVEAVQKVVPLVRDLLASAAPPKPKT